MKNVVRGGLARSAGRKKITNGWFQQQMARGQQFYSSHRHQRTREETWLSNEHLFLSSQINEVPGARPRVERKNRGLPVGTRIVIRCGQFPLNVRPSGSGAVAAAGSINPARHERDQISTDWCRAARRETKRKVFYPWRSAVQGSTLAAVRAGT
jgi:hypothetical protein